jgi:hypothetical protein
MTHGHISLDVSREAHAPALAKRFDSDAIIAVGVRRCQPVSRQGNRPDIGISERAPKGEGGREASKRFGFGGRRG